MDKQRFVSLFQEVLAPDTERVKSATTTLKEEYYPLPESLSVLLQLLLSDQASSLRQLASTQARSLISKHWKTFSAEQKSEARQQLLQATLREDEQLLRHAQSRVISAIAKVDLANGEWPNLLDLLVQGANSPTPRHREVSTYIMFTTLESAGDQVMHRFQEILALFRKTIDDPASGEVRINTMLALSRLAMVLDTQNDEESLRGVQEAVPQMVGVLKQAIDAEDADRSMQCFEVFQTLLGCEASILNPHFANLVRFMMTVASEKDIDQDARTQALSFLIQCVEYRRLKIQGLKIGEQLTLKALEIATELGDSSSDDEKGTTARSALALLDILSSKLPPSQVVVPLLHALGPYVNSPDPDRRQGGVLALSMCVEGAPDFIATQLKEIFPLILRLLEDENARVRNAALDAVMRLAEDLTEDIGREHERLVPALVKCVDMAMKTLRGSSDEKSLEQIRSSCNALDSLVEGLKPEETSAYLPELVPRFSRLVSHPDLKTKGAAIGALGGVAASAKESFLPYFEQTMNALSEYVQAKDGEDELDLRCQTCDAMGSMALAVGPKAFQRFVRPLMEATEEGLQLDHPQLRETSFMFWGTMAKVYGHDFNPFLEGVLKGIFDHLETEESELEVELGEEAKDLVGKEVTIGGKKVKVAALDDEDAAFETLDLDGLSDLADDDDDEWSDLNAITAVAQEKEIGVEVLGDIASQMAEDFLPYVEKTFGIIIPLSEHPYEGIRRAAIGSLYRIFAAVWGLQLAEKKKWNPGLPLEAQPAPEIAKMGEVVMGTTMSMWEGEDDGATVTEINRSIAAALKLCGPFIISDTSTLKSVTEAVTSIITKNHSCQQDYGDDSDAEDLDEASEFDWLLIDSALDVVIAIAIALGPTFGELWKIFEKPIMKYASSSEAIERSTAIGTIAECIRAMRNAVTPYTTTLLKLLLHRLSDEDPETKSNAAFGIGLLQENSTNDKEILGSFNTILSKLEPLLHTDEARAKDNAAGCVSRMIVRHQGQMPVDAILPGLIDLLPLKADFEENEPVYDMIVHLYSKLPAVIVPHTEGLLPILAQVLAPPQEQLKDPTREKVVGLVKFIASKEPGMVNSVKGLAEVIQ